MALLSRALSLAPMLRGSAACPGCVRAFANDIAQADSPTVDDLRMQCADMWTACVGVLTHAPSALAGSGPRACPAHSDEGTFDVLLDAVCVCLHVGLSAAVRRAQRKHAVFGKPGKWPLQPADIFPTSDAVSAYVRHETPAQTQLLADVLFVAHTLVFPAVLLTKDALAGALVRRLTDPGSLDAAVALIRGISDAPDAVPDALLQLTLGHEEALFDAAVHALTTADDAPHIGNALAKFAASLVPRLEVLDHNLHPLVRAELTDDSTLGLAGIVYELFQEIATRKRVCVAPGCGSSVTGRFARCKECGVAVYCGRACQRRDWDRESAVAHKVVCPLLRKIFAVADLSMSRGAFERAVVNAYQWSYPESETMAHFALSHNCLPMKYQLRAMQFHVAILGVMNVPVGDFQVVFQDPEFQAAVEVMTRQENWAAGA